MLSFPATNSSPPEPCWQYFVERLEWIWRSGESSVSLGHVLTGKRLQPTLLHLTTSSKQSCLVGSNLVWTLLGYQLDLSVGWIASSNYLIFANHHRLPEKHKNSPAILLNYYSAVPSDATAPHAPSHSSAGSRSYHSWYPAWYSSADQNQHPSKGVSTLPKVLSLSS